MEQRKDRMQNKIYRERALSYFRNVPCLSYEKDTETGAFYQEDGSLIIRLFLPNVHRLEMILYVSGKVQISIPVKRKDEGVFEGIISMQESYAGSQRLVLFADGIEYLSPELPIGWIGNQPANIVEIPELEDDYIQSAGISHGYMLSAIYDSKVVGMEMRCIIYTPPEYMNSQETYPVLYLLHGGTENELAWATFYKVRSIMDRLIAEQKARPCLIVMNNGMVRFTQNEEFVWDGAMEDMLIKDCIPFVEQEFRVKRGKWNRAVAGLSMGAYMTNDIGLRHPELFGYMGQFTGCMYHETDFPDYERPYLKVMEEARKDLSSFSRNYRLFFRSTTPLEDHFDYFEKDDDICRKAGIDKLSCYHRIVYPSQTSKCSSWRQGLRDFMKLVFQQAEE